MPRLAQTILQKYCLVLTVVASPLGFSTKFPIPHFKKKMSFAKFCLAYCGYTELKNQPERPIRVLAKKSKNEEPIRAPRSGS